MSSFCGMVMATSKGSTMSYKFPLTVVTGCSQHALRVAYKCGDIDWYQYLITNTEKRMMEMADNYTIAEMYSIKDSNGKQLMQLLDYRRIAVKSWSENLKEVT